MPLASGTYVELEGRGVLRLAGEDRVSFLQGLVSNDVAAVASDRPLYACLLTPQGKFLHDFFLIEVDGALLIECEGARRGDLMERLRKFKLRSKIEIADVSDSYSSFAIQGAPTVAAPPGAMFYADPRASELGIRALLPRATAAAAPAGPGFLAADRNDYDRVRIASAVPDGSRDMEPEKAILLESNIDLLNGISWDKGCYMGQELTARTRYRGLIKKRLVPVQIDGTVPAIGAPLIENGREVGEMRSSAGDMGLALLRLDRVREGREIGTETAVLHPRVPPRLEAILAQPADG